MKIRDSFLRARIPGLSQSDRRLTLPTARQNGACRPAVNLRTIQGVLTYRCQASCKVLTLWGTRQAQLGVKLVSAPESPPPEDSTARHYISERGVKYFDLAGY